MFSYLWPSKPSESKVPETTQDKLPELNLEETAKTKGDGLDGLDGLKVRVESLPVPLVALVAFGLGFACSTGGALLFIRYGKRIKNSDWVTPDVLDKKRWICGMVTSVGDADNFRLFHTPSFGGWRWPFKFRGVPTSSKELKYQTIHIRIAGVDAPEAAHFGKPEQPHAAESLTWLRQKILGKIVYCQLIRRDQYVRVVANVHLAPRFLPGALFFGKNLPLEMLRAGCVTTYEQAGAEYGKEGKKEYLRVEAEAKAARRGMWADGAVKESPAEYKRRLGSVSPASSDVETTKKQKTRRRIAAQTSTGWFSRIF